MASSGKGPCGPSVDVRHPAPDLVGTRALKSGHMRCLLSGVSQSPLSSSPAQGPIPSPHHLQCPFLAHLLLHPGRLQTTSSVEEGSLLFFSCWITGMWSQPASFIHLTQLWDTLNPHATCSAVESPREICPPTPLGPHPGHHSASAIW